MKTNLDVLESRQSGAAQAFAWVSLGAEEPCVIWLDRLVIGSWVINLGGLAVAIVFWQAKIWELLHNYVAQGGVR